MLEQLLNSSKEKKKINGTETSVHISAYDYPL